MGAWVWVWEVLAEAVVVEEVEGDKKRDTGTDEDEGV